MKAYRVMMQRIGGHNTLFTTVEAEDEFQALNEANTTWGTINSSILVRS